MTNNIFALGVGVLLLAGCAAEATDPEPTHQDPPPAAVVETDDVHPASVATIGSTAGASTGGSDLGKAAATHPCTVCFGTMGGVYCVTTTCSD